MPVLPARLNPTSSLTVRAEVPGFEENELDVQINQDTLIIRAEKEQSGDGRC